jgi:hypothetical protein
MLQFINQLPTNVYRGSDEASSPLLITQANELEEYKIQYQRLIVRTHPVNMSFPTTLIIYSALQ